MIELVFALLGVVGQVLNANHILVIPQFCINIMYILCAISLCLDIYITYKTTKFR